MLCDLMAQAYVFINSAIGRGDKVFKKVKRVEGALYAYQLLGLYDTVVKIEAENEEKLKARILNDIRRLEYVRSTLTNIVV